MENGEEVAMWEDDDALWDAYKDELMMREEAYDEPDCDDEPTKWVLVKRDAAYWDSDDAPF